MGPAHPRVDSRPVTTLVRDGLELRYEVLGGSGPALLLPQLNFSWPDYLDLSPFTERFTVITASPRGFGVGGRLDADLPYRVSDLADDLIAVVQAVGFDRFVVLGYSFTGAFAPWLAQLTGRADAVVSGGFPIVGDYASIYPEIQRQSDAAKSDPAAWARVDAAFDNRAALTFYRDLSELPPDSLVSDLPCPLFAFWGDQDEELGPGGTKHLASGLDRHGLQHASFPGYDHDGMLDHLDDAVPEVLAWLDRR
jgi:pimeloyl-ACP methyl ester carboxylesterase